MFSNRQQAGALLAQKVAGFLSQSRQIDFKDVVVLGLPRGGVPVALEIALTLGCQLNVLGSKKIGAPDQKELAVGAVTADGVTLVDENLIAYLKISPDYIKREKEYLVNKVKLLEQRWRNSAGIELKPDVNHKIVIVVDDGVATGMTALAAARSLSSQGANQIIFATPVISYPAFNLLLQEYDQVIALESPVDFGAVGQFYSDFNQVEDMEVVRALVQAANSSEVNVR